jgi:alpha-tubulin suppressor-like RCC1 family protein
VSSLVANCTASAMRILQYALLCAGCSLHCLVTATVNDISLTSFASGPTTGVQLVGVDGGDWFGYYVNTAGDFNGDGLMDIVVPALFSSVSGRYQAGAAYIIFGSTELGAGGRVDMATFQSGSDGFRIIGATAGDQFGAVVAGGGDVNGDGYDDVVVGSRTHNPGGRPEAGAVWVIFGRPKGSTFTDIDLASLPAQLGIKIYGAAANSWLHQCAIVGDMNGDGFDDIVLGAQLHNGVDTYTGRAYVIFGKSSMSNIDLATTNYGTVSGVTDSFIISGSEYNSQLGQYVGTAGDFNGDGYSDALVISQRSNYAMVIFGHSGATPFINFAGSPTFSQSGYGFSIVGFARQQGLPGDINQDGIDDLFLHNGLMSSVTTWVIFGHRSGPYPDLDLTTFAFNTNTGFKITTSAGDGCMGTFGGDLNGDGIGDLYVTAPYASSSAGIGYAVYFHSNATTYTDLDLATFTTSSSAGYRILGASAGDAGGGGVQWLGGAALGDVNGDGFDDVAWSAPFFDYNGRTDGGSVYILLSSPTPTVAPTAAPTIVPTARPTVEPSATPTAAPTAVPTQPTSQPTLPGQLSLDTLSSYPTYRPRNGFAFAAVNSAGRAYTWGEGQFGGNSSALQAALLSDVTKVVPSRFAFAALKSNGSVVTWGAQMNDRTLAAYAGISYAIDTLIANEVAFAGIDALTGRVVAFGSKLHGGEVLDDKYCNGYSTQLSAGVRSITASAGAFAALKVDGTLYAWGNKFSGADVAQSFLTTLSGAKVVVATAGAFAVLLFDYRVTAWGDKMTGGNSSAVANQLHDVLHITASRTCFVAYKQDSGVVVWGYGKYGGDTSSVAAQLASQVVYVAHTHTAMAAVKADGTVVTWGTAGNGGDSSALSGLGGLTDVVHVYGNARAFAALTVGGSVVAWGHAAYGGSIPADKMSALSSGVVSIYHTDRAFAALKDDGSLVVWGQAGHGGSPGVTVEALLTSDVHTVCANDVAFSAIRTDGSVVAWGHDVSVPVDGVQFASAGLQLPVKCA